MRRRPTIPLPEQVIHQQPVQSYATPLIILDIHETLHLEQILQMPQPRLAMPVYLQLLSMQAFQFPLQAVHFRNHAIERFKRRVLGGGGFGARFRGRGEIAEERRGFALEVALCGFEVSAGQLVGHAQERLVLRFFLEAER